MVAAAQVVCDYLSEYFTNKLVEDWMTLNRTDVFPVVNISKRKADWEVDVEVRHIQHVTSYEEMPDNIFFAML